MNLGDHPNTAQIRNAVKLHVMLEMLSWRNILRDNESFRWRDDINILGKLAAISHLLNLDIAHAEISQAIGIALQTAYSLLGQCAGKWNSP